MEIPEWALWVSIVLSWVTLLAWAVVGGAAIAEYRNGAREQILKAELRRCEHQRSLLDKENKEMIKLRYKNKCGEISP